MSYSELDPTPASLNPLARTVDYAFSENLAEVLEHLSASILISTYDAGKVVVVDGDSGRVRLSFHNYEPPMGIAVDAALSRLAVATQDAIVISHNEPHIARQLPKPTGCLFLARKSHFTGNIAAHQIGWVDDELWIANTRFSCLCTLDDRHSFVPRWRPSFVTELAAEDRCHLNGMAISNGRVKYVTVLAQSNVAEGWRATKATSGTLIDVETNACVATGLSMPHSPEVYRSGVLLLNSGEGSLAYVDARGDVSAVARFPGYTRGLSVTGNVAVVGLSKIRESATFGNLPISERAKQLKCGVAVVDIDRGELLSQLEFKSGIDEIFDVTVVSHPGATQLRGPRHREDGLDTIWTIPTDTKSA